MTAGTLGLAIGETQRVVAQVEDSLGEAEHYTDHQRAQAATALDDLARRLDHARRSLLAAAGRAG